MARLLLVAAAAPAMLAASPLAAQDDPASAADDGRIAFDLADHASEDEDDGDWGIAAFRAANPDNAAPQSSSLPRCQSDGDIIQAQASGPRRYDENGAVIRSSATCSLDRPQPQSTAPTQTDRFAVLREGECEESASGYACANSGRLGSGRFERETQCSETATGRTCGGSVTWGNSEDGRNAAREELERMLRD